ncbi:uncharacterized protein N7529_004312 [Penicillium soppii]|uniref:uncharacterized protein n=1 Tax=Penicillium soppii TaxID=69789 RepID=UPI0025497B52|nr:uncharacterized protein N7529_004312 [Penicillium soppii]KAJ5871959.1 hypothetical protein N7529_004312 [Penicillium soppii]
MAPLTTAERIRAVEHIIDYEFHDKALLEKALGAAGATADPEGNKRIALVGDAVLRLAHHDSCYQDQASTGEMTISHNGKAANENLSRICCSLGISVYIKLNPSARGVIQSSLMATTIEAIIGAVWLDLNILGSHFPGGITIPLRR